VEHTLVITEKPSVARDIAAALGGFSKGDECLERSDIVITWALGHLLELCEPQDYDPALRSWSLRLLPIVPDPFRTKPRDGQKKRLDGIKRLARGATGLVNACDAGREGELVYRRIVEFLGLGELPQRRLWLQSMTPGAIRDAFTRLERAEAYDRLGDAAWLRAVGDWLVGMNATRALTQRLKSRNEVASWSAGRVQTPTLAMLVAREHEILAHRPRPYRMLRARFQGGQPEHLWEGRFVDAAAPSEDRDAKPDRIFDLERAAALAEAVRLAGQGVASEKRKPARQNPPLPYDLTTLQREANRRSGMSAKRTLDAAQRLYEQHKLTTYPRTDSRHLPSDYGPTVAAVLDALAAGGLGDVSDVAAGVVSAGPQNLSVLLDDAGVTDHFAIVPTGNLPPSPLTGDDARVWDLIVRGFLASLMGPATWATVEREVQIPSAGGATFRATSRTLEVPGFLAALGQEASDEQRLPPLVSGDDAPRGVAAAVLGVDVDDKMTTPPPRLSEAQLLRMMEAAGEEIDDSELSEAVAGRGLGTPATRADVIEKLVAGADAYARRVEGRLMPTHKGIKLVDVLERMQAGALASPRLTGEWELALREVERGRRERKDVLDGLVRTTRELASRLRDAEFKALYAGSPPVGDCPACGAPVSENPWGYPCSRNLGPGEGCDFMLWKDRSGRYVDRTLAERLVVERRVPGVEGLVDRSGRLLPAVTLTLRKDEAAGRWTVDLSAGDAPTPNVAETEVGPLGACPAHEDCTVVETSVRYACRRRLEGTDTKGPSLPRVVCAREVAPAEALAWFADGRTTLLEGFISRRGRPFKGSLVRKPTGGYGFEFPERPERPGRRAATDPAKEPKPKPKKAARPKKKASPTKKGAAAKASTRRSGGTRRAAGASSAQAAVAAE
jgi:DNA topoisomerase-3